jgi:hypothetical protein
MRMQDEHTAGGRLTYWERIALTWFLAWRGVVIGAAIGFLVGALLGFAGIVLGIPRESTTILIRVVVFLVGFLFITPAIVLPMMLRKRFRSFHLEVRRTG